MTTLYSFCSQGGIMCTDGNLYGTTFYGGASGYGVVFSVSVP